MVWLTGAIYQVEANETREIMRFYPYSTVVSEISHVLGPFSLN